MKLNKWINENMVGYQYIFYGLHYPNLGDCGRPPRIPKGLAPTTRNHIDHGDYIPPIRLIDCQLWLQDK